LDRGCLGFGACSDTKQTIKVLGTPHKGASSYCIFIVVQGLQDLESKLGSQPILYRIYKTDYSR
jgi:hypothetical protein